MSREGDNYLKRRARLNQKTPVEGQERAAWSVVTDPAQTRKVSSLGRGAE